METVRGLEIYTRIGRLRYTLDISKLRQHKGYLMDGYKRDTVNGITFFLENLNRWTL